VKHFSLKNVGTQIGLVVLLVIVLAVVGVVQEGGFVGKAPFRADGIPLDSEFNLIIPPPSAPAPAPASVAATPAATAPVTAPASATTGGTAAVGGAPVTLTSQQLADALGAAVHQQAQAQTATGANGIQLVNVPGAGRLPTSELSRYVTTNPDGTTTVTGSYSKGVWTGSDNVQRRYSSSGTSFVTGGGEVHVWAAGEGDGSGSFIQSGYTANIGEYGDVTNLREHGDYLILTYKEGVTQVNDQVMPTAVYNDISGSLGSVTVTGDQIGDTNTWKTTVTPDSVEGAPTPQSTTYYTSNLGDGHSAKLTIEQGETTGDLVVTHSDDGSLFSPTETTFSGVTPTIGNDDSITFTSDGTTFFISADGTTAKAFTGSDIDNVGISTDSLKDGTITTYAKDEVREESFDSNGKRTDLEINYKNGYAQWDSDTVSGANPGHNIYRYNQRGEIVSSFTDYNEDGVRDNNEPIYVPRRDGGYDKYGEGKEPTYDENGHPIEKELADGAEPDVSEEQMEKENPELDSERDWNDVLRGKSALGTVGNILAHYEPMHALSGLLFGDELIGEWRETIDKFFASAYLGIDYWTSEICSAEFDVIGGEVAAIETASGIYQFIGTIQGERSEPVPLLCDVNNTCAKGICRRDGLCVDSNNQTFDEYFYKITYGVAAPDDEDFTPYLDESGAISFNIVVSGKEKSASLWTDFVDIDGGDGKNDVVVKYSPYLYTKVCLIFGKKPEGRNGEISEVCNKLSTSQKSFVNYKNNQGSSPAPGSGPGSSSGGPAVYCPTCW
jgi:hypothetical protein